MVCLGCVRVCVSVMVATTYMCMSVHTNAVLEKRANVGTPEEMEGMGAISRQVDNVTNTQATVSKRREGQNCW